MLHTDRTLRLQVNGEDRIFSAPLTLLELLAIMNFNPRLIAIEYNGEILNRQYWETQLIQEGDRLEIVTIVGGG
jgi:sulfur carrier protein